MTKPSRKAKWGRAGVVLFAICAADFYFAGLTNTSVNNILLLLGVLIGALLFIDYGTTG